MNTHAKWNVQPNHAPIDWTVQRDEGSFYVNEIPLTCIDKHRLYINVLLNTCRQPLTILDTDRHDDTYDLERAVVPG